MEENSTNKTSYFAARYSLFEDNPQMQIDDILQPKTKEEVFDSFIDKLKNDIRLQIPINKDYFVIYYSESLSKSRHLFKFAKETKRTLNQATISDITETQISDFPWCLVIVDTEKQLFIISKNNKLSQNIITLKNHIAKAISYLLKYRRVSLKLELITDKHVFWNSIEQNSGEIYSVELTLISPNILGQSYSTTTMLNELKNECNNDSMTWKFANTNGNLKISHNSSFF